MVDQLVITNGEGGYRYSLLAESYYGVALTDEAVGRAALPEIRKRELLDAGHILGIANHFFLDERDVRYTQDIDEVLGEHWNAALVLAEVERRMTAGNYDFVFTLFPSPETHGGHKAATLTALTQRSRRQGRKPVVLGCQDSRSGDVSNHRGRVSRARSIHSARCRRSIATDRTGEVWLQERARLSDHRELGDRRAQIAGAVSERYEPLRSRGIRDPGERVYSWHSRAIPSGT